MNYVCFVKILISQFMNKNIFLLCKIICALILLQTLYFKFTAAPESVYIFSTLGMEPWGRIGSGIVELIAAVLLLTSRWDWLGGLIALATICGALFFHLTKLGISIQGDRGYLFALAIVVFILSALVVLIRRNQIPVINKILK